MRMFRTLLQTLVALGVAWPAPARAVQEDLTAREEARHAVRVGAIGGVGFPRPLAIEPMVELGDLVALGVEYGGLPTTNIDGVQTSLWALSADARVFPFGGAFFFGLGAGLQHIGAQATVNVAGYSAPETLGVDSWFLNPRLGLLWTTRAGFAVGIDAGVQIPLSSSTTSSLPLGLAPDAQRAADVLGGSWLPTIDLLRLGFLL